MEFDFWLVCEAAVVNPSPCPSLRGRGIPMANLAGRDGGAAGRAGITGPAGRGFKRR